MLLAPTPPAGIYAVLIASLILNSLQFFGKQSSHLGHFPAELLSSPPPREGGQSDYDGGLAGAMDRAVRMLLPGERGEEYVRKSPGCDFRFYVYDNLRQDMTWQYFSLCIEKKYNVPDWYDAVEWGNRTSNCDWASTACTETQRSSSKYSTRRFNRNGDAVLSKIFSEYNGTLRTHDPREADIFIVPYASTAHCLCRNKGRCYRVKFGRDVQKRLLDRLDYLNASTLSRHVFFNSAQQDIAKSAMRNLPLLVGLEPRRDMIKLGENSGQVSMPYVNTNPEFQPNSSVIKGGDTKPPKERTFAIGAIIGQSGVKIDKQQMRNALLEEATKFMERNQTIAGYPIYVANHTSDGLEQEAFGLYRNSIFCPCLRGDTPGQKRFFDVILNGCIPVVMKYEVSHERGYPSYYESKGSSIRIVYPFAKGNFYGEPDMGIDYSTLVVSIDGKCGIPCLFPTLEDLLLNHQDRVLQLQRNIAQVATLFTFGMEKNALRYTDAITAALVQIRHFILCDQAHGMNSTVGGENQ